MVDNTSAALLGESPSATSLCRFGTQDSTGLGVKIEKMCWGSWTPHKVKLAVSGCPRNCAEATIKDVGVVCVEAGYDIVVGGNGGVEVRVSDPLVRVGTEAEVLEYVGAFLQLYREEARYLERTAPWVARMGIAYVRERVARSPNWAERCWATAGSRLDASTTFHVAAPGASVDREQAC